MTYRVKNIALTSFRLILLFSTFCISYKALAIVSMESVHLGKPPQGFSGAFDLSFDADYGNTEERTASTGIKLQNTKAPTIGIKKTI